MGIEFDGLVDSIFITISSTFWNLQGFAELLDVGKVGKYIHSLGGNACMGGAGIGGLGEKREWQPGKGCSVCEWWEEGSREGSECSTASSTACWQRQGLYGAVR